MVKEKQPEISFVDGDHRIVGALQDHMLVREYSKADFFLKCESRKV
jgi:hypothetical protein